MKEKPKEKQIPNHDKYIKVEMVESDDLVGLLKETRIKLGLSVQELAIILGSKERTCRRWEAGGSEISGESLSRLYKLREAYPEVFLEQVEIDKTSDIEQQEQSRLLVKELVTELNNHQQKLVKEIALTISKNSSENKNKNTNANNTDSDIKELFNRNIRLEKRLAFLEEKCGYPYNPPQHQSQYGQQYDNRNKRRR